MPLSINAVVDQNATQHQLEYTVDGGAPFVTVINTFPTSLNVQPTTSLSVRIRSGNSSNIFSEWSAPVEYLVESAPSTPTNITITP